MRRYALLPVMVILILLAFVVSAAATTTAETATVSIYYTKFYGNDHVRVIGSSTTRIHVGDTVRWHNADRCCKKHQVVAANGSFVSPVLRPKDKWSHTFNSKGVFKYRDGLDPKQIGWVVVS